MRGTVKREPDLQLPDLPHGVTEITITHNGRTSVVHSRKPWTEVMAECEKRYTEPGNPIGGPVLPTKLPAAPAPRGPRAASLPYKDDA